MKEQCQEHISDQQAQQLARLIIQDATMSMGNALVRQPKRLIPPADSGLSEMVF